MLTEWSPRHPLQPVHPPGLSAWTRALCGISHATCCLSTWLRGALLSFCSLLMVCQILFKLNLMAKTSDLQGSIIKSLCILVGFFEIAFVILKEYFLYLQFQEYFIIKAGNKEANHLQQQQLGSFLLFALNICTIHTDFLQTDTLFPGEYYWQNLDIKKHQSRGLRTGHYVVKNITGGNYCKSWY